MNIKVEREFPIGVEKSVIDSRLAKWSATYGLTCVKQQADYWQFHRGSHLVAAFTFDVRKVPTTVTVTLSKSDPMLANCIVHVCSPWNIATPGDPKRVEEQVEILIAYIKGCFDNER